MAAIKLPALGLSAVIAIAPSSIPSLKRGCIGLPVTRLDLTWVDLGGRRLTVVEKGGATHTYQISREGAHAIQAYLARERAQDTARWPSPALFLTAAPGCPGARAAHGPSDQYGLECCLSRRQGGATPHSARHAMGKHIIAKTGILRRCNSNSDTGRRVRDANMPGRAAELGRVLDDR